MKRVSLSESSGKPSPVVPGEEVGSKVKHKEDDEYSDAELVGR